MLFKNPASAYRHALDAALGWQQTAAVTHNSRHWETALICARSARERFAALLASELDQTQHAELMAIEAEAQIVAHVGEMRDSIAECRAILARTKPRGLVPQESPVTPLAEAPRDAVAAL